MKTNKKYYPVIAASCLAFGALIPVSAGEKEPSKLATQVQAAEDDALIEALNARVIDPLNEQAKRFGEFSRRGPSHKTSYHLVESTQKSDEGQRNFTIVLKKTPFVKGAKSTDSDYLKLRYLEKGDQVLINLKDAWVGLEEHPIIKKLPIVKPELTGNIQP